MVCGLSVRRCSDVNCLIRLQPAKKGAHTYSAVACGLCSFVNSMPRYLKESAHAKRAPPNVKTGTLSPLELKCTNLRLGSTYHQSFPLSIRMQPI
eukprot:794402-Pelagomonas_calceolata.AAC.1